MPHTLRCRYHVPLIRRQVFGACLSIAFMIPAFGQHVEVSLPAGEAVAIERQSIPIESLDRYRPEVWLSILGPAPVLAEVSVGGPSCSPALHIEKVVFAVEGTQVVHGPYWSRFYTTDHLNFRHMQLPLEFADGRSGVLPADEGAEPLLWEGEWVPNVPQGWECELVVRLVREPLCTMWASVSGDVNRAAFGSVAYFNTFADGVPITTGTIADEGMHEELEGFLAMAEGMMELAVEMGYDVPDPDPERVDHAATPSASDAVRRMRDEMFAEGGDTFGLTLTEVRTAEGNGDDESTMGELADGLGVDSGGLTDLARGISAMADTFTLEASAAGGVEFLESDAESGGSESDPVITVPLSSLRVVPGGLDGNLNRVPFVYDGVQGSAQLVIHDFSEDYIIGSVAGNLFTESVYDGEKKQINVNATFAARRGFKSCMR